MGSGLAARDVDGAHPGGAQSGRAAFESWVEPHWPSMARFAARLAGADGEDVLQEALLLAWRKRGRFDPQRDTARSWLLALVADAGRKHHRRSLRVAVPGPASDRSVEYDGAGSIDVERAVRSLSARQKLAVDLYYFLDLPMAEVAAVMGCSEGTAKSTLSDARARLRDQLGDDR